jgi:hypothetical protein
MITYTLEMINFKSGKVYIDRKGKDIMTTSINGAVEGKI